MSIKTLTFSIIYAGVIFSSLALMGYSRPVVTTSGGFNHGANPYWSNRNYTDPNLYYGINSEDYYYGQVLGGVNPPSDSSPGMSDDSDALYDSYLRSNPPRSY